MARRRKRSKKWIYWLVFLVLVAAAVTVCYFVWDGYFRKKDEDESGVDNSSNSSVIVDEGGKGGIEKPVEENKLPEKEEVKQYEGEDPNKLDKLTGAVTYVDKVGDNLVIRVNIDQYLSGGSCEIVLKNGADVYNEVVNIIDSAATSTCEGFNVPLAGLPSGKTQIIIYLSAEEKVGEIRGEIEL